MDPDVLEAARLAFNCKLDRGAPRCTHLPPHLRAALDVYLTKAWGPAALGLERPIAPEQKPYRGEDGLTDRERDVLALLAKGWTDDEISALLFVAAGTVKNHLQRASKVLGLRGRVRLARWFWETHER